MDSKLYDREMGMGVAVIIGAHDDTIDNEKALNLIHTRATQDVTDSPNSPFSLPPPSPRGIEGGGDMARRV